MWWRLPLSRIGAEMRELCRPTLGRYPVPQSTRIQKKRLKMKSDPNLSYAEAAKQIKTKPVMSALAPKEISIQRIPTQNHRIDNATPGPIMTIRTTQLTQGHGNIHDHVNDPDVPS